MHGIEQFYEEKSDYVNKVSDTVTGHYESMISTQYYYVGMSCFRLATGGWYGVSQEFIARTSGLDETKDTTAGACTQYIEITDSSISKLSLYDMPEYVGMNDSGTFQVKATAVYPNYYGYKISYSGFLQTDTWQSSDSTVLDVDESGNWRGMGVSGDVTISVGEDSLTQSADIYVYDPEHVLVVTPPDQTTYLVGEALVLTGGKVTNLMTGKSASLSTSNTSGFDSSEAGICEVTVSYGGFEETFETLIVAAPECSAEYGDLLSDVALPESEYGEYSLTDGETTYLTAAITAWSRQAA